MKIQFHTKSLVLVAVALIAPGEVYSGDMPSIIPDPPPSSKPVSEYTAADVFSISSTESESLPPDHPYLADPKYTKVIARDWPARKDPRKIDELVGFILLSPGRDDEASELRSALENNVSYIICEIMDVTREEKADALLRVIANQTDPVKKSLARSFACDMFKVLLDPRLIQPMRDEFTNPETWEDTDIPEADPDDFASGLGGTQIESAKSEAVGMIVAALGFVGIELDDSTFFTTDHDADCVRMGQWLDANVGLIHQKCLEARNANKFSTWSEYCVEWTPR